MEKDEEKELLRRCLEGDTAALVELHDCHQTALRGLLVTRGATPMEAEDLLADLWGDCVAGGEERPSLLEKYSGKCTLLPWLITVATNRLYDLKRKQRGQSRRTAGTPAPHARVPTADPDRRNENGLVDLLRCSLEKAITACGANELLMLRLVYLHGVTQREVGRLWGWHETKVSRTLARAMREIEDRTLQQVRRIDPWMELAWEDFLDLCETHQTGFI